MYKNFGVTVALNHIDLVVKPGEIRGLIGENGSGKSTVSSIVAGMQPATSGEMLFKGEPWKPSSPLEAQEHGIAMMVQEAGTIAGISVAENIFLGHEKMFAKYSIVNKRAMVAEAQKILDDLGITDIDPSWRTARLDMQARKLVELAKALYWKPDLFIVDESTTALSQTGRDLLYKAMHRLRDENKSVLFISHDLDELIEQCDAVTVLRDGNIIGSLDRNEFDEDVMKKMMVGREIKGDYYRSDLDGYGDKLVLKADCITTLNDLLCFSMELHEGEILGIGGLSECGMHTVGRALFGIEEVLDGRVVCGENGDEIKNPRIAIKNRMAYVSKNRDTESLALSSSIQENIASTGYKTNRSFGPFISGRKERKYVSDQVSSLSIKCASQYHAVNTLSGGNKQKVVFGKWIAADADILILDCPTRGVDIGVKAAMYKLIYEMKKAGKAIILISEEMSELIGMADRLLIMKDGEVTYEASRKDGLDEREIIKYMI
jgi:ribose transport system ATP-binding protein